jgi:hypothetical protein
MSFGIAEVISLLLGMQGFGLAPNPKAPSPDVSLEYAIPDADMVGHFDAASVIPGNYKVLSQLPDQPAIKANPEFAKAIRKALNEIEGPRSMAKAMVGFDPITDLSDADAFMQIKGKHDVVFVVVAHGKFSTAIIDKVAKLSNKAAVKIGGAAWVDPGDGSPAVGITKSGVLIAGTAALVKDRMADTWKAPAHGANTTLGVAADMLAGHPVFGFAITFSATSKALALKEMPPGFASDMIKRGHGFSFGVYSDGIGWQWGDSSVAGLDAMAQVSEGVADLLKAAQIAPRGFAKIALGALESYRGVNKQVDAMLAHKADITKIVESYTGDGSFKVKIDKDPKALKLSVRLTGKSVSEVVPFGVVIPMAAVGFLFVEKRAPDTMTAPPMVMPEPMPAPKKSK